MSMFEGRSKKTKKTVKKGGLDVTIVETEEAMSETETYEGDYSDVDTSVSEADNVLPRAASFEADPVRVRADNRERAIVSRDRDMKDPRFKVVYDGVKKMIVGRQFNVRQFTVLVPLAMQLLAEVTSMTGEQKKEMIIKVFKYLVEEQEFEDLDQERLAQHFVENDLEVLIDTAYAASKGKFVFKDETLDEAYDVEKFNMVYGNIKRMIVDKEVNIKTILILVPTIMIQAARFVNLTGLQKKDLVIHVVAKLVGEYKPKSETMTLIKLFIEKQLPTIIDIIYQAAKSKYIFKKIKESKVWKKVFLCGCCHASED